MPEPKLINKLMAEFLGTLWLTFGGCGSAVLAAKFIATEGSTPINLGIGLVGVSLAFGLTVLTMAFAVGHISDGHFNPAVSLGLVVGKRFPAAQLLPYWIAQVVGATVGALILYIIASGAKDFSSAGFAGAGGFATNGFGDLSPGGFSMISCLVAKVVLTAFFLIIILGATDARAAGFRAHRDWSGPDADSLDRYSRDQLERQSGAFDWPGVVRGRRSHRAIVVVLAGAFTGRGDWRIYLSDYGWRFRHARR